MPLTQMAYIDATQLDSDLEDVADAIRAKSGGSSPMAFPAGFISEIGSISVPTLDTLTATDNGTYTPQSGHAYDEVIVNVPKGITPSGTLPITDNGTYDVTQYASAEVNVQTGGGGTSKATGSFTIIDDRNNNQPTIAHNLGTQKIAVVIYPVSISATAGYQMFYISFVNVPAVVDSGVWSLDFRSYNSAKFPEIVDVDPQNSSDNSYLKTIALQDSPWTTQNQWYSATNASKDYSYVELTNDTFRTKHRWATGSYKWVAFALE